MGMYLNSKAPYEMYKKIVKSLYFVDKSLLLTELIPSFGSINCYCCITRPRRFGKTIMANMIGAFFGQTDSTDNIFDTLAISKQPEYKLHLNKHHVIYIDFSRAPKNCKSYTQYIARIEDGILEDLIASYAGCCLSKADSVWDALQKINEKTDDKFLFVLDEWDAVFHMPFVSREEQQEYLLFLKWLLKDQSYVEFTYMTGVLPIMKYSSGSELNMFLEYTMATREKYSEYFGFTDEEVDGLYQQYLKLEKQPQVSREGLRYWYDGYQTAAGKRLYNPRSVVCALSDNQLGSYWTSSGPYEEIFKYIGANVDAVRDSLALMVSGTRVQAKVQEYAATSMRLKTRDEIFSAMVVYGFLSYEKGYVKIPNRELMGKFDDMLLKEPSLGYVNRLAEVSSQMLKATLRADTAKMTEILEFAHNTETPLMEYNHETELTALVSLVYLAARDSYRVEREDKAGTGYVDFIFYPETDSKADGIILELKVGHTPEEALKQIRDRKYALKFEGKLGEKPRYAGRILGVGIAYDRDTKVHSCRVEVLREAL